MVEIGAFLVAIRCQSDEKGSLEIKEKSENELKDDYIRSIDSRYNSGYQSDEPVAYTTFAEEHPGILLVWLKLAAETVDIFLDKGIAIDIL